MSKQERTVNDTIVKKKGFDYETVIFVIAVSLFLITVILDMSLIGIDGRVTQIIRYTAYGLVVIKSAAGLFLRKYKWDELIKYLIAIVILGIGYIFNRNKVMLLYSIIAFAAVNIETELLMKVYFCVQGVLVTGIVILSRLGLIFDYIYEEPDRIRHFLGFEYTTYSPIFFLFMILEYVFIKKGKINIFEYLAGLSVSLILFKWTGTKFAFLASVATLTFFFATQIRMKKGVITQKIGIALCAIPWLSAALSIWAQAAYNENGAGWARINEILHQRLRLGHDAIGTYGFSLFGKVIDWVGSSYKEMVPENYNYVDCSYLQIALQQGFVFLILVLVLYTYSIIVMIKNKKYYGAWIIGIICLFSITEPRLVNVVFNPFVAAGITLIGAGSRLKNDQNPENDPSKITIPGLLEKSSNIVFCVGSKSIGQYGGYESFVKGLVELDKDDSYLYFVACKANGEGCMIPEKLDGAKKIGETEFVYEKAVGFLINANTKLGPAQAIKYDIDSLKATIEYIEKYNIKNAKVYVMACRIGPFFGSYVRKLHKLGAKVFINPDGHEWKRSKWSAPVRAYWKYSEKLMVKNADVIICDSINIEKYIKGTYAGFNPQTTFIAYGADETKSELPDDYPALVEWNKKNNPEGKPYYLIVGRFVPENNYETMIREFIASSTDKKLIVITTDNPKFRQKLEDELHFSNDPRICFAGTVYDRQMLKKIRENAFAYLHGHEVGGTNPSLLESLSSTKLNLLYNVGFNEEVAGDSALYWSKDAGSLSELIEKADKLSTEEIKEFSRKAHDRIKESYRWDYIIDSLHGIWEKN